MLWSNADSRRLQIEIPNGLQPYGGVNEAEQLKI